ncbi:MAG: aminotransferase class I/II-fold pyridoxal phosphate-dependent enzyme, partial [Eggerthellaceae bacterium]|nr:aminotransferase class I/II-fold pyridoxal phosphate-dependent enzyme [Eggerthellaceae bacterium]
MSLFLSKWLDGLEAYIPGEQPQNKEFLKLNTNESPFPPHPEISDVVADKAKTLKLYCDPDSCKLREVLAEKSGLATENFLVTNSGDEALNYAFTAFCDNGTPAIFPDLTYGFYRVFADFHRVEYREIPLKQDFSIDVYDYKNAG